MRLEREVSGIEEFDDRVGVIALESAAHEWLL
jgi:hypothetical protein